MDENDWLIGFCTWLQYFFIFIFLVCGWLIFSSLLPICLLSSHVVFIIIWKLKRTSLLFIMDSPFFTPITGFISKLYSYTSKIYGLLLFFRRLFFGVLLSSFNYTKPKIKESTFFVIVCIFIINKGEKVNFIREKENVNNKVINK